MSVLAGHTAAGQLVGYLWQLERALIRLLKAPNGTSVAVEALDDVALVDAKTGAILGLEQDKSTIGTGNNLNDGNKNLWKTLCIWAGAAKNDEIDLDRVFLYFVTPVKVPPALVRSISEAKTTQQATLVLQQLRATAVSEGTQRYKTELAAHSDELLKRLIIAIDLIDGNDSYVAGGFQEAVNHHFGFDEPQKGQQLAYSLLGWFVLRTAELIRAGQQAWTDRITFFHELHNQVERVSYRRALEAIEFVLQDSELEAHRNSLFVKQLDLIRAEPDEIIEAISDYLKLKALRTEWAVNSRVTREELEVFDDNLIIRWKTIYRRLCALCKSAPEETGKASRSTTQRSIIANPLQGNRRNSTSPLGVGTMLWQMTLPRSLVGTLDSSSSYLPK